LNLFVIMESGPFVLTYMLHSQGILQFAIASHEVPSSSLQNYA
jgi:hypothetical protein